MEKSYLEKIQIHKEISLQDFIRGQNYGWLFCIQFVRLF